MDLRKHAIIHNNDITTRLATEIQYSIDNSKLYFPETIVERIEGNGGCVRLAHTSSQGALIDSFSQPGVPAGRRCLLNFASYKKPGGLYFEGAASQEEALCHVSTLYPVLKNFDSTYYKINRRSLNRGLYRNAAIYSKDIIFEAKGKQYKTDVLTCAAPNWGVAHSYQHVDSEENERVFKDRIDFMYSVARENGCETLIAGAWGCGVFRQDPKLACRLLVESKYRPPLVILAIPDELNYTPFRNTLDKLRQARSVAHQGKLEGEE